MYLYQLNCATSRSKDFIYFLRVWHLQTKNSMHKSYTLTQYCLTTSRSKSNFDDPTHPMFNHFEMPLLESYPPNISVTVDYLYPPIPNDLISGVSQSIPICPLAQWDLLQSQLLCGIIRGNTFTIDHEAHLLIGENRISVSSLGRLGPG